jgi:hypothetical protein
MVLQRLSSQTDPQFAPLLLEYATTRFDWGFWQYYGFEFCGSVPTAASTDEAFWRFFSQFSGISGPAPATTMADYSSGALYYEWLTQQGFALQINAEVEPLLVEPSALATMEDDYRSQFPGVELPAYDGSLTLVVRTWAEKAAENLLLIYGDFDPWSGGAMDQPSRPSSARFFVPRATHGAQISNLEPDDRTAALAIASRLFGQQPVLLKRGELHRELLDRENQRDFAIGWRMKRR